MMGAAPHMDGHISLYRDTSRDTYKSSKYGTQEVFIVRCYAKRGICRHRVSVCQSEYVCVCHTPVLYQNG